MNRSILFLSLMMSMAACNNGDKDPTEPTDTDSTMDTDAPVDTDTTDTNDDTDTPDDTDTTPVDDYEFSYACDSTLAGESSISYSGQVFRQVLIGEMKSHLSAMTARLNDGTLTPVSGDITRELEFYFDFDSATSGDIDLYLTTTPAAQQSTFNDVSSGKDLNGKIAGNDATGQSKDWSTEFVGIGAAGSTNPEALVRGWFAEIDAQAVAWANDGAPLGPDGLPVAKVFLMPDGRDLQQLLEKFIRGSLSLSQGADDYLDNDIDGKGLLSDHTALDQNDDGTDKSYTKLEHQWDEGFGYFGAARSYDGWTNDEIADDKAMDDNGDMAIDLKSEYCFGHSVNAAKRDRGANVATNMTGEAFDNFLAGRQLLCSTAGTELTADQRTELYGYRDAAVLAWEQAISSTVIHYINDTLQDMGKMGTMDYDFATHAKHWGEMKGFALSFQFNPYSPVTAGDFTTMHDLMGDAPVLATAGDAALGQYATDLITARTLLGTAYGFDDANLGDDNGENGW
jgi:hypothetical protein